MPPQVLAVKPTPTPQKELHSHTLDGYIPIMGHPLETGIYRRSYLPNGKGVCMMGQTGEERERERQR